ncbi:hypothetical protein [Aureibacter tunicatorum]|uniref:Uncharacterized protein n=1 Tax=Aureibacter tunicatorum TaxID=866807 RepID=A0AAE3XKH2_9BACT|nr:hypothetical protein [Aureibacter tunicatorum]MDR6239481.1 hypothetical protein [Aureibacter tunicatorum]BDD04597.1 hypothetical protein AUTU_20800 [Aureibacter tunicatorum]
MSNTLFFQNNSFSKKVFDKESLFEQFAFTHSKDLFGRESVLIDAEKG